ncbi:MAG: hypothetical protein ACK56I_35610, partial [bacterium]
MRAGAKLGVVCEGSVGGRCGLGVQRAKERAKPAAIGALSRSRQGRAWRMRARMRQGAAKVASAPAVEQDRQVARVDQSALVEVVGRVVDAPRVQDLREVHGRDERIAIEVRGVHGELAAAVDESRRRWLRGGQEHGELCAQEHIG